MLRFFSLLIIFSPLIFAGGGIAIQTGELPRAILGAEYTAEIHSDVDGLCPNGNVALFVESGSLPRGLRASAQGLAGVPREMGMFRFRIKAQNKCASATQDFELLVTGRPILRASPERLQITVSPDAAPEKLSTLIASTWPLVPYSLSTPDASWIKLASLQGVTPDEGSALSGDRATITIVPRELAPGIHYGTVIVSAWQATAIRIEITVTVLQPPAPPIRY